MIKFFSEIETAVPLTFPPSSNYKVTNYHPCNSPPNNLSLTHLPPSCQPNRYKSNLDFYRGRTKSVYEREPIFKEFARNIPLSQQNLWDNANMTSLKKDFQRLLATRNLSTKTDSGLRDPLRPLTVDTFSPCFLQTR